MLNLTKDFIEICSTILGRFDSQTIDLIIKGFHNEINVLSKNLKEKFQQLIPCENMSSIKIQLGIINHFKQRYFSELISNNNRSRFLIEDEIMLAYAFLLAEIDDQLSEDELKYLKFLFGIRQSVTSIFELYTQSGEKIEEFFIQVLQLISNQRQFSVKVTNILQEFNEFIIKYKAFLKDFEIYNQQSRNNESNPVNETLSDQNYIDVINSFASMYQILDNDRCGSNGQLLSSSHIPKKGLCVIINISEFTRSNHFHVRPRPGSDKDVKFLTTVFKKLKFTVLVSDSNFTKANFDEVLEKVNNKDQFEYHDCLIIFIMSHGLLHSFFAADSEEIVIRSFVRKFSDTSATTIWTGKPRLFIIQACRTLWPTDNPSLQNNNRIGITQNDLSPKMLVAYACSPSEESKRNTEYGTIYIQIFCLLLLKFGHCLSIQNILDQAAVFLDAYNECSASARNTSVVNQRPEYIEREFNTKLRWSNQCLMDNYASWENEEQIVLGFSLGLKDAIYNFMKQKSR